MRLQHQLASVRNNKTYGKWVVVIPPDLVAELGWEEGEVLEASAESSRLVVSRKKAGTGKQLEALTKMKYEEFRDKVQGVLSGAGKGLTWTDIREEGKFYQKVPNNKWVRRLEHDIELKRESVRGRGVVWRLRTGHSSG